MKIARKFTLTLLACVLVALGVNAFASVAAQLRRYERLVTAHESVTANALRPAITQLWRTDGRARALKAVEHANAGVPEVDIRWVSLASNADADVRPKLPRDRLTAVAAGEDLLVTDHDFENGDGRIFQYVAMQLPNEPPSAIEVSESLKPERELRRTAWRSALLTAAEIGLAAALTAAALGVWFVGRPIRRLMEQVDRIGAGDLSTRTDLPQNDEIGALAMALNGMSGRLAASQEREASAVREQLRMLDQIRHADRLATVGRLAAGMAHELGTPLNVVDARAKSIGAGRVEGDAAREAARGISEQVDRMTRLVRQLLEFARRRELQKSDADLAALAKRTTTFLASVAAKQRVALAFELERSGEQRARVDATQLEQVITNLVMNAVQASPAGETVTVRVTRDVARPPVDDGRGTLACACIAVVDRGSGIASGNLARIFEPFFTTKAVGDGTGLGLSVSYGIVKDHGGWITVQSEPGKGSIFVVHLPLEAS